MQYDTPEDDGYSRSKTTVAPQDVAAGSDHILWLAFFNIESLKWSRRKACVIGKSCTSIGHVP